MTYFRLFGDSGRARHLRFHHFLVTEYLTSDYDMSTHWQILLREKESKRVSTASTREEPFMHFILGHGTTLIIAASHLYLNRHERYGDLCHVFSAW